MCFTLQKERTMKFNRTTLLGDLKTQVNAATGKVHDFKQLTTEKLNFKKSPESWSILECIEHLNLYGDFYLPEIERQILAAPKSPMAETFKSGWLGNYFANSMLPKDGKVNKMKTFKKMNPANSQLPLTTIDRFLKQQEHLLTLLRLAETVDLTKTTTGITLTSLLRFRLGDTFRFFINHIERHVLQAERVLQ